VNDRPAADRPGIVVNIDGGARGNPGPAGFGVRIEQHDRTLIEGVLAAMDAADRS
jgi:ribonuclease HI